MPALMELNVLKLFGEKLNSASDPADLFGIGVGALVIVAAHYNSERINKLINKGAEAWDKNMQPTLSRIMLPVVKALYPSNRNRVK